VEQVKIVLSLCEQLGLTKVLLVGHADGGLLSLMVASALMEGKKNWGVQVRPSGRHGGLGLGC
jgi:pimeloyl-ACP methyl ester carboxylesterase